MLHLVPGTGTAQRRRTRRTQPDQKPVAVPSREGRSAAPAIEKAQQPQFRVQVGHTLPINTLALSADGSQLLSGSEDHSLILWDTASGIMLRQYTMHVSSSIKSVAFSPDGTKLVVMSELFVSVMDVVTSKQLYLYTGGTEFFGMPMSVAISNDGRLLLVGDNFGQSGHIFNLITGRKVREYKPIGGSLFPLTWQSAAFSSDGKKFIIGGCPIIPGGCEATVWDTDTRRVLHRFSIDETEGQFLFTKDGSGVFVRSSGRLLLYSFNAKRIVSSFEGLIGDTGGKSLSDDGNKVWTVSEDGSSAALWDVSTGKRLEDFSPGADAFVNSVFYQEGKSFALTTDATERHISIWDVRRKQPKVEFERYGHRVTAGAFSPDGSKVLLADSSHSAVLWDLLSGKPELRLGGHQGIVNAVAFSADGSKIVTGSDDHSTILWDAATGRVVKIFDESDSVAGVAFTKDGARIVTVSVDSFFRYPKTSVMLTDVSQMQALSLKAALGKLNINVTTWDASTFGMVNRWLKPIDVHGNFAFPNFSISPDGDSIALSEFNDTVTLYDAITGSVKRRFKDDGAYVDAISFSQNGQQILVDNQAGDVNQLALSIARGEPNTGFFGQRMITLWDVNGEGKATARGEFMSEGFRYAPGGNYIYSTVANNITQSEYPGFKVRHVFNGHTALVRSISASVQRGLVLTTSDDGTARIWTQDGVELFRLISLDRNWVVVRPDGRFDTGSFDEIKSLQWVLPDAPNNPLSVEIFMRDYYEPRLLRRILKGETLLQLPSLAGLNRIQPAIEGIDIKPHRDNASVVDVTVKVASVTGQCLRDGKQVNCDSGVYDLRLYRDGQLVKQLPAPDGTITKVAGTNWRQQLQQWRQTSVVKKDGKAVSAATGPQEITFTAVPLPKRAGVSAVEFTAYAFNEDRVKSATSKPAVYPLPQPRPGAQRRAYVITVGVDVTSAGWRLRFARKGVTEIEALLQKSLGSHQQYQVVPIQLLSAYQKNSDELLNLATKRNIQTVLNILSGREVSKADREKIPHQEQLQSATPDDLVFLYIASHGYVDPAGKFYVLPSDIGPPLGVSEELLDRCLKNSEQSSQCDNGRKLLQHGISSEELTQWLGAIDAGQMVLILDSCHSGAVAGPGFKPGPMGDRSFGQLSYDKGMLVLAAAQPEQLGTGTLALGNRSLLTYALTQQFTGPVVDLRQWLSDAEQRVPKLYQQYVKADSGSDSNEAEQQPILFDFSRHK